MKTLDGKVMVVTGASRGLGRAIAEAAAREGAKVVLTARTASKLEEVVAGITAAGGEAVSVPCDVADLEAVRGVARLALERLGALDVWVNNAGTSATYGPMVDIDVAAFDRVIDTNIRGTYYGTVTALRHFAEVGRGKLINLYGRGDDRPVPMQAPYTASKAWVQSFTRSVAKEAEGKGYEVMAINPGLTDTDMLRRIDVVEGFEQKVTPLATVIQIWGHPPEVPAAKVVWMASGATDGKNGLEVRVLSRSKMLGGALGWLGRKVTGRLGEKPTLEVHPKPAATGKG